MGNGSQKTVSQSRLNPTHRISLDSDYYLMLDSNGKVKLAVPRHRTRHRRWCFFILSGRMDSGHHLADATARIGSSEAQPSKPKSEAMNFIASLSVSQLGGHLELGRRGRSLNERPGHLARRARSRRRIRQRRRQHYFRRRHAGGRCVIPFGRDGAGACPAAERRNDIPTGHGNIFLTTADGPSHCRGSLDLDKGATEVATREYRGNRRAIPMREASMRVGGIIGHYDYQLRVTLKRRQIFLDGQCSCEFISSRRLPNCGVRSLTKCNSGNTQEQFCNILHDKYPFHA